MMVGDFPNNAVIVGMPTKVIKGKDIVSKYV